MRIAAPALAGAFEPLALEVHFQPKVRLVERRIPVAYEALLRGRRNGRVVGTKEAFATIATRSPVERMALRSAVALSMIDQAARATAILRTGVAVNVEPDMLACPAFLEAAGRLAGCCCHPVTLEVIEEATMASIGAMASGVEALRRAGFRIALDDFGIAESNLMRLTRLVVDEVKIDATLLDFGRGRAMLLHLVSAIHAVGAQACIEGVETPEHHAIALASGADLGQGYLYGPPAPIRAG